MASAAASGMRAGDAGAVPFRPGGTVTHPRRICIGVDPDLHDGEPGQTGAAAAGSTAIHAAQPSTGSSATSRATRAA